MGDLICWSSPGVTHRSIWFLYPLWLLYSLPRIYIEIIQKSEPIQLVVVVWLSSAEFKRRGFDYVINFFTGSAWIPIKAYRRFLERGSVQCWGHRILESTIIGGQWLEMVWNIKIYVHNSFNWRDPTNFNIILKEILLRIISFTLMYSWFI